MNSKLACKSFTFKCISCERSDYFPFPIRVSNFNRPTNKKLNWADLKCDYEKTTFWASNRARSSSSLIKVYQTETEAYIICFIRRKVKQLSEVKGNLIIVLACYRIVLLQPN
ncbi:hypothetical protein L1987_04748 [Smallanthus sonchifolius]|uniref:Uncharacterized protein n=1 Tax=Smallanthus sonchifolius TaxID=185202 RepID=A0ACB9JTK5_9ASTR|nr:hypothetical protein L1987_04748 [Smallanthus sonchifolius]